jgi:competence protein ComEC
VGWVPVAFLSHFHSDHIGGIDGLLKHKPSRLILPAFPEPAVGRQAVVSAASGAKVPVAEAKPGDAWTVGEVTLRVLATDRLSGTRSDSNNNSLILTATVSGVSVLLLGDAETEQQALLRQEAMVSAVEVLKVAHHGSSYQDVALLDGLRPRVALVSVGVGNGYGHPSETLLAHLRAGGARVCRTDQDGDVAVIRDAAKGLAVVRR